MDMLNLITPNRPTKSIVISQSNYIPWLGYFHLIASADTLVILDDVQYTKNDWRNRNRILFNNKPNWITVPVKKPFGLQSKINEVLVADHDWQEKHLHKINTQYKNSPQYKKIINHVTKIYEDTKSYQYLSDINMSILKNILELIEIKVKIIDSKNIIKSSDKSQRLIDICNYLNATQYISAPTAKSYLNHELFKKSNLVVKYFEYGHYDTSEVKMSIVHHLFHTNLKTIKSLVSRKEF